MARMKKVYKATLRRGLGSCKVFAWDEEDAKRAALVTYLYNSGMSNPNPKVEDVVASVELDPEQLMDSIMMQPASQYDSRSVVAAEKRN